MYDLFGWDEVVPLEDVPEPSMGAPSPLMYAEEWSTVLAYIVAKPVSPRYSDNAFITFCTCRAVMFGPPGEDDGHPLEGDGATAPGAYEVKGSSWILTLGLADEGYHHYLFRFHDNTVGCIAKEYRVEVVVGPLGNFLQEMDRIR
jgi:hypothetical protein